MMDVLRRFINWDAVKEHHDLAMNPRHPHVQGTSQGPDIFFQCVEVRNKKGVAFGVFSWFSILAKICQLFMYPISMCRSMRYFWAPWQIRGPKIEKTIFQHIIYFLIRICCSFSLGCWISTQLKFCEKESFSWRLWRLETPSMTTWLISSKQSPGDDEQSCLQTRSSFQHFLDMAQKDNSSKGAKSYSIL